MLALIMLNILGLLASLICLYIDRSWEPLITSLGLVATLIAQFHVDNVKRNFKMTQKGGKGSKNYQAKGNITIKE